MMLGHVKLFCHRITTIFAGISHLPIRRTSRVSCDRSHIIMTMRRNYFFNTIAAFTADMVPQAIFCTSGVLLCNPLAIIMPICSNRGYDIFFAAYFAPIISIAVLRTSCILCQKLTTVTVPGCFHKIGRIPFAANRTYMLGITLISASRRNDLRLTINVSVACMLPLCGKHNIARHSHSVGIAFPTEEGVALSCRNRCLDYTAIGQRIRIEYRAVRIEEYHRIGAQRRFDHRTGGDVLRGSCGHGVYTAIAIQIPADQCIFVLLIGSNRKIRLADDLRGQVITTVDNIPVYIIESRIDPLVAVVHRVAVVPVRVIVIPHDVERARFRIYGDPRDI